jgi:hypothetical protein
MENKETIEEVAEKLARAFDNDNYKALMDLVIDGAKWQKEQDKNEPTTEEMLEALEELKKAPLIFVPDERMYSKEEVLGVFEQFQLNLPLHYEFLVKEHLKQFKKK